ncbi:hypothetical protein P5673_025406 [Acropora cervicornis]|uniref:DUF5641 domain-containing protein n=1 Tax=Acropora cervicornis TaxID=6130 RepID=A0AAD9Q278_ACRCE|nr:hypothetical protein P5673_025406 [Acropora cervicornis]
MSICDITKCSTAQQEGGSAISADISDRREDQERTSLATVYIDSNTSVLLQTAIADEKNRDPLVEEMKKFCELESIGVLSKEASVSDSEAFELYSKAKCRMRDGGFHLRKWISNSRKLITWSDQEGVPITVCKLLKGKDEWPNPMVVTGLPGDFYDEMRSCDNPKNKLIRSTGLVVESRITSLSDVRDLEYRSELSRKTALFTVTAVPLLETLEKKSTKWNCENITKLRKETNGRSIKQGDIVTMMEEGKSNRGTRKLVRVQEVHPANDGLARGSTVEVISNKGKRIRIKRPLQTLYLLEVTTREVADASSPTY